MGQIIVVRSATILRDLTDVAAMLAIDFVQMDSFVMVRSYVIINVRGSSISHICDTKLGCYGNLPLKVTKSLF